MNPFDRLRIQLIPPPQKQNQNLSGFLYHILYLNQPIANLFHPKSEALRRFSDAGLVTLEEVLHRPAEFWSTVPKLELTVSAFLSDLAVLPHIKLVGAVFRQKPIPVSIEAESKTIDGVNSTIVTLIKPNKKIIDNRSYNQGNATIDKRFVLWLVIIRRFGLFDGIPRSFDKIGSMQEFNVSPNRIKQLIDKALFNLRRNPITYSGIPPSPKFEENPLKKFLSSPE